MKGMRPIVGPVELRVAAAYPWPKRYSRRKREANSWRISRPDYDNIAKIIGDALNGIAWIDDAQIAKATVEKFFEDEPGLTVWIGGLG
jgi:Holliday junction resolvase RusA-like endonuclease